MALKNRDAFKALEEIVGPDYISEEPAVLDSYAFNWGAELFTNTPFLPRAGAIVLPQCTEEIQSIVKLCNKLNVRYKAITNGWGFYCALGLDENAIHVDMRRMNRILEINEKSMFAVVEPYVTCSQLQGELMRRGFNMNMAGAGAGTSAMPVTAHMGTGPTGLTTSWNDRNCLAVEWVQPNGDILKLGSLATGAGWFCGDGPGPSLRGVIRGPQTPMGGLGIFTRAATKIYPWYGPPKPEIVGSSPYYKLKEMPPNYDVHHPVFPSWDKLVEAAIKIGQAEVAMAIFRLPPPMLNEACTGNGDEAQEFLAKMKAEVGDRPGFICILHGASIAEFNYRKKVFNQILKETAGELFSAFEDEENKKEYLWTFVKLSTPIRESFRAVGRFLGALGDSANYKTSTKMMLECMELKKEYQARGNVRADDGLDCVLGYVHENGHSGHAEQLIMCHPSGAGWKDLMEFTDRCEDLAISKHYTAPTTVWGDRSHDKWGPHCCNYHLWLRKIKKAFDPKGVSEAAMYINARE